ncbi:MAG: hypothetical protein QXK12_04900 [Candidatus Nezhaarchaeales archaeon]
MDSRTSIDVLRIIGKLGFKVEYVRDGRYNSLERVNAKHWYETFGSRNPVKRGFRSLKHRLKKFHGFKHKIEYKNPAWFRALEKGNTIRS